MIPVDVNELAGGGEVFQLLAEQTAVLAAAQAQFPDELLVSGAAAGQPLDMAQQIAVRHG